MTKNNLVWLAVTFLLLTVTLASTGCDDKFYLDEKEFYALRGQIADQQTANIAFADMRNHTLTITFDNSVSPPRLQSSTLRQLMRDHMLGLTVLEGTNAIRIDRVAGEIEGQFDNWLSGELRLYTGPSNSDVRLTRVEQMRLMFLDNPVFSFSTNRITYDANVQIEVDNSIHVHAVDSFIDFFARINGDYDTTVHINTMHLHGEMAFYAAANDWSNMSFRLRPTISRANVTTRGRASTPSPSGSVTNGISDFVARALSAPIETDLAQKYDLFSLANCRVQGQFQCVYRPRPDSTTPELQAVVRGTDNHLYATSRRDAVWWGLSLIRAERYTSGRRREVFAFTTDPSLAVSGGRSVELAATTTLGGIYYAQYQNQWQPGHYIEPIGVRDRGNRYTGKPAIAATGPGQVEVVAARQNGTLVHLRRVANTWSTPRVLALPAGHRYRDPVTAVSNNRVFLAAVGDDNRIYTMVYDLETQLWSQSQQPVMAEGVTFAPAIAPSGDRQIDMVYVGQAGRLYHRTFDLSVSNIRPNVGDSGVSYSQERQIPGNVISQPALVATGYHQLDLVARGTNNVLYYNHFTGPRSPHGLFDGRTIVAGWSDWSDLNGLFYGTQVRSGGTTEDFALTATHGGKVDLVARLRQPFTSGYALNHNGFNAVTYGRQPWKAVHWRGFQRVADLGIVGRPALAALDTGFGAQFAAMGPDPGEYDPAGLLAVRDH